MIFFEKNVKYLCKKHKIKQKSIADTLETSRQALENMLKSNNPTVRTAIKICDVFNITLDELIRKDLTI